VPVADAKQPIEPQVVVHGEADNRQDRAANVAGFVLFPGLRADFRCSGGLLLGDAEPQACELQPLAESLGSSDGRLRQKLDYYDEPCLS
jgi:hypothetical protein